MSTHSSLFGLIRRVRCDRCGEQIEFYRRALCPSCANTDFQSLRLSELLDDWQQGQTGYRTCCVCRKTFEAALTYDICLNCARQHADYSHVMWDDRVPPRGITWAKHCFVCNSVQVVHSPGDGSAPTFRYLRVGSRDLIDTRFRCPQVYPNDLKEVVRSCDHDWIEVASTVTSRRDGKRVRAELSGDPLISRLKLPPFFGQVAKPRLW
jgi:hypothetical protein